MLLGGIGIPLAHEHFQRGDQHSAGLGGLDHIVHHALLGGVQASGHLLHIFGGVLGAGFLHAQFLVGLDLVLIEHCHGGLGGQGGDHCGGPCVGHIGHRLAAHGHISLTNSVAGHDGHLGHSRLGIGVQQLALSLEQPALLLHAVHLHAAGVQQADHGNAVAVHEADEPGGLLQRAGGQSAVGGHQTHAGAAQTGQRHLDGRLISRVQLHQRALIGDRVQQRIRVGGIDGGQQTVQIVRVHDFGVLQIAGGQQGQYLAGLQQGFVLAGGGQSAGARFSSDLRAAELLRVHLRAVHGGHDLRAEDHQLAYLFRHDGHIRQLRQQRSAADAGAQHQRHHGADAAHTGHLLINFRIRAQRLSTLVDAHTGAVHHRQHRSAGLLRQIQQLDDLRRLQLAHRAAAHGEILSKQVYRTFIDGGIAGDHTRALIVPAHQRKQLHKAARVGDLGNALACGQFSGIPLLFQALLISRQNFLAKTEHLFQSLRVMHFRSPSTPLNNISWLDQAGISNFILIFTIPFLPPVFLPNRDIFDNFFPFFLCLALSGF